MIDEPCLAAPDLAAEWEARYQESESIWSGHPNAVLARHIGDLVPVGRGIDLGCGEGADAIYLATHGWEMTGLDIAYTALDRAAASARQAGVDVAWAQVDLTAWVPETTYDLVTAFFLHSRGEFRRDEILRVAAGAVAPGGLLLIAGHWTTPPWSSHHHEGHDGPEFDSVDDTLAEVGIGEGSAWELLVAAPEPRTVESDGETAEILDAVILARRSA